MNSYILKRYMPLNVKLEFLGMEEKLPVLQNILGFQKIN
jgi:hypothetical protein